MSNVESFYRPNVVLFSGGMDSTIALYHTIHDCKGPIIGLFVNYGQRHIREWNAANDVWSLAKIGYPDKVGLLHYIAIPNAIPKVGPLLELGLPASLLHRDDGASVDAAFVPHRNMLLMTLAAMWARSWGADMIVTGIRGGFSDCTEEFEHRLETMLGLSDPRDPVINLTSPVHISRADSLNLASKLPGCWEALAFTMTCFKGGVGQPGKELPCGLCLPCTKRAEGFAELGLPDPSIERVLSECHVTTC